MRYTRREFLAMSTLLVLSGCAGGNSSASSSAASVAQSVEQDASSVTSAAAETVDFDGAGHAEVGDLTFYLSTAGGTTEGGNVPKIVVKPNTYGTSVDVNVENGDGTICNVYIDGHKRDTLNAGRAQHSIQLEDSDKTEGKHKVELVSADDDGATIYKVAEYEIVAA